MTHDIVLCYVDEISKDETMYLNQLETKATNNVQYSTYIEQNAQIMENLYLWSYVLNIKVPKAFKTLVKFIIICIGIIFMVVQYSTCFKKPA